MNTDLARIEYKFHLSAEVFRSILPEIEGRLGGDRTVRQVRYPVVSEYWDTPYRDIHWERIRGLKERRKFRIRIYGTRDGAIPPAAFLEIKHKSFGQGVKRRLGWNIDDLSAVQQDPTRLLSDGLDRLPRREAAIRREILLLIERRALRPSCQIRYERMAFEDSGGDADLRVTFDSEVRCRRDILPLVPDCTRFPLPVTPDGLHIMEVKAHGSMPYWMRELIGRNHLLPRGFSKYGTAMEMYDPVARGAAPDHGHAA